MFQISKLSPLWAVLLGACASMPTGPSILVLPGTGKNFDQFRADEAVCRQYAYEQVGGATAERARDDSAVRSAVVGTVVGAAAGAAIGGGRGAGIGAGSGLIVGSLAGTGASEQSGYSAQRRYDYSYQQCMYAKGHKVPVYGRVMEQQSSHAASIPPPPPGSPPPPPPR